MNRKFTKLLAIILFSIICLSTMSAQTVINNGVKPNHEKDGFHLAMAYPNPEPEPPQEESGILDNAHIRIINLGPQINYEGLDYAPTISVDGRTLYFVSDREGSKLDEDGFPSHDFWAAEKKEIEDTVFTKLPYNIDPESQGFSGVNTMFNEGAASIGNQIIYFTGCDRPDGLGNCDLYSSTLIGREWGTPINLGRNVNSKYWDSQPSISAQGNMLFFTSNRPGPISDDDDNFDIWYSEFDFEMNEWKPAKNLTDINTEGREFSPFIAADGVSLFFSSDKHEPNYGGLDFYRTVFNPETGKWSKPQNLGRVINTEDDEYFITIPAAANVIYWSSRRTDYEGYQGDLDIFMAFVPKFFRTVNVIATVVDECSDEFIPATIEIKNTTTGSSKIDSVTIDKPEFSFVVTNADYAKGEDAVTYQLIASNPKYGEKIKYVEVNKPIETDDPELAKKHADEIHVKVTLGQKPVIASEIEEAEYVADQKRKIPEIADFRGLVMEEVQKWDLYPLLNYVFFDIGSSEIPDRYILLNEDYKASFTDTTIPGGTLDKYYHLLNIYGYRLNKYTDAKIEIVGCNDDKSPEEKVPGLSKARATNVYNYFKDVWNISEDRMKIVVRDEPKVRSNPRDSLGIQENRRVEILCDDWNIMKPVFDKDPKIFPQPKEMNFNLKNGIEDAIVADRRIEIMHGNDTWNVLNDIGLKESKHTWDWKNTKGDYPKDEIPFIAQLIVTTKSGSECKSEPINIPVMQVSTEEKVVQVGGDTLYENYSLILFPFDRSDAGPLNEKIMNDYVYERIKPSSKVDVIGHTDVVGLYEHNKKLSERRSNTVHKGIERKAKGNYFSLSVSGVGEDEPLYDNQLPEGRFYNRTVQVLIKTPTSAYED